MPQNCKTLSTIWPTRVTSIMGTCLYWVRAYIEVRAVFIAPALINVEHDFEALLEHKNNNVLHNVSLTECRVPSNFGELSILKRVWPHSY